MKIKRLTLRGFIGIQKGLGLTELTLDWSQFLPGVVVVLGPNGSGKTTIVDNLHPFRSLASRAGTLQSHVFLEDAFRELEFEFQGHAVVSRIQVDAKNKTQAAFLSIDGKLVNDGKATTYDAEIFKLVGTERLFFNSVFSAQHRTSITSLTKGERKDLFVELLGLNHLQIVSDRAKKVGERIETAVIGAKAKVERIRDLDQEIDKVQHYRRTQTELKESAKRDLMRLGAARTSLKDDINELTEREKAAQLKVLAREEEAKRVHALVERASTAMLTFDDLKMEKEVARQLTEQLPDLEKKQAEVDRLRERIRELSAQATVAVTELSGARVLTEQLNSEKARHNTEMDLLQREIRALEKQTEAATLVPCKEQAALFNTCPLLQTARGAAGSLHSSRERLKELSATPAEWQEVETKCEAVRKKWGDTNFNDEAAIAYRQLDLIRPDELVLALAKSREAADSLSQLEQAVTKAQDEWTRTEAEAAEAQKRAEEIGNLRAEFDKVHAEAHGQRQKLVEMDARHRSAEHLLATVDTRIKEYVAQEGKLTAERADLQEIAASIATKEDTADRWKVIAKAFGKDGIQAFELDTAGPQVSEVANDLLQAAFGTKFSVSLETLRYNPGTKTYQEVFDIVIQRDDGTKQLVETLSGGERVWIECALGEAIAIVNQRALGTRFQTAFHDEADGALDVDNKWRYLRLLERSQELVGRHQTIVITQDQGIASAVQQRLILENGKVRMEM